MEKINHIRIIKNGESLPLTEGQRRKLIELAHKSDSITYLKVRKELGLGEEWRFNMLRYEAGVQPEDVDYINAHYAEEITLDHLAQKFYVSKYHLSHEFSRVVGSGVYRYILLKRLLMARELLMLATPPGEVALRCGFQEYSNFYRAFRTHYGASPRSYLAQGCKHSDAGPA